MLAINGGSPEALRAFSVAGGEYEAPPAAIGALFKEILGKAGVMVSESSSNADVDTSLCIICARPTRSAAALESLLRLLPAARLDDFKLQVSPA
jgi:rhodanese-related sulfurtransferase